MNKRLHFLITILITVASLIISPLIYESPLFTNNEKTTPTPLSVRIKKDNNLLNKSEREIRIMTINLLAHYKSWGGKSVEDRSGLFLELCQGYKPDVIGLQEMCLDWYTKILNSKTDYKFTSPIKTTFPQKLTAIIYNCKTVELIDSGSKAFSDCLNFKTRRIVWGVFKQKSTNNIFIVVNTHFSLIESSQKNENFFTQACQVKELYTTTSLLLSSYNHPVFIIGDFNTKRRAIYQNSVINSGSYGILTSLYTDAEAVTKNKYSGEKRSFCDVLNDHIFIKGDVTVKNLSLLSYNQLEALSDHFPLLADISL